MPETFVSAREMRWPDGFVCPACGHEMPLPHMNRFHRPLDHSIVGPVTVIAVGMHLVYLSEFPSASRTGIAVQLSSFAWHYNRRYQLQTMIPRFVDSAARTQPMPYRLLIAG